MRDRKTEKQSSESRQGNREIEGQIYRDAERHMERQRYRKIEKQRDSETEIQIDG